MNSCFNQLQLQPATFLKKYFLRRYFSMILAEYFGTNLYFGKACKASCLYFQWLFQSLSDALQRFCLYLAVEEITLSVSRLHTRIHSSSMLVKCQLSWRLCIRWRKFEITLIIKSFVSVRLANRCPQSFQFFHENIKVMYFTCDDQHVLRTLNK